MKYGVPHHDHEGRLTGVAYDNDGDGIYDDYEEVVSRPLSSGDGYSVVGSDNDGDGVYDDVTFVAHAVKTPEKTSSPDRQTYYHSPSKRNYSGKSFFSTEEKLKIAGIVVLVLASLSFLTYVVVFLIALVYAIVA